MFRPMRLTLLLALICSPALGFAHPFGTARLPIVSGEPATADQLMSTVAVVDSQTGVPFCTGPLVCQVLPPSLLT